MMRMKMLPVVFAFCSVAALAQETAETDLTITPEVKLSYLDSIKSTFIRHENLAAIDSMWMKELSSTDLFDAMQEDIESTNPDEEVDYDLSTEVLKQRLAALDAKSPFHIEYSKNLENIIKSYLKRRSRGYERLMAISEYYFPMFEEHLAKYNVPIEIKYLAVIESALNPMAKSRVGATGLWQFMYPTGKQYGLEVNSYVDERCDPIKATEAACQYLSSLYNMFGDWDLVLASYNAGPGNVTKAIRRSGEYRNYWNIRAKLPRETQGYVPAFLATMYVYEYAKEHGITAQKAPMTYFETDTVMVKRQMSFKQVAGLLDVPVQQLQFLNPIYKLDVIPFMADKPHYLRLPKDKIGLFTANEPAIYAYIQHEDDQREKPYFVEEREAYAAAGKTTKTTTQTYKVRSGDNLGAIANKYDVSVAELKKWNRLRSNMLQIGQRLKVHKTVVVDVPVKQEAVAKAKPKAKEAKQETKEVKEAAVKETAVAVVNEAEEATDEAKDKEATAAAETKTAVASIKEKRAKDINYDEERMYIVQKGDSLFSIAKKHPGVTVENLKEWNKMNDEKLMPGMKLKLKVANAVN